MHWQNNENTESRHDRRGYPHHTTFQAIIVSTMVPVTERTSGILTRRQYSASENSDHLIQNKYLWSTSTYQTRGIP